MLIIQMLMKRALSGSLPLMAAGAKLQEEILSGPSFSEAAEGPWAEQERILTGAKKAFLLAAGTPMQKFREKLADQQEIVAALSDIVIELYAMESALLRARKTGSARGAGSSAAMRAAACALLEDGATRIETHARTVLAAAVEGDMLRTQLAVLRRFLKREPVDSIALRRVVAEAVESTGRYPFDWR
jgi:butyryl-CoA dehydrogenase